MIQSGKELPLITAEIIHHDNHFQPWYSLKENKIATVPCL